MSIIGITCLRDDGPYVVEWIAHHLAAGFDHMVVLSHDCTDGSDVLLERLVQSGRVTHVPFTPSGNKSVQWQALKIARDLPLVRQADWVMPFDCDEFLCLPSGQASVQEMIAHVLSAGETDAIALPWRLFGSSGALHTNGTMTPARFTRAAPVDLGFPLAHLIKTLHRPKAFRQLGVHRPRNKADMVGVWRTANGTVLPAGFAANDGAISMFGLPHEPEAARMNHYSLRSLDEFMVKRDRGLPNHMDREIGVTYWAERNWNSVEDTSILPMLGQTQGQCDALLALPDVQAAHEHCLADHAARAIDALDNIEALRLHFRLQLLTGSTPPSQEAAAKFYAAQVALLRANKDTA